MMASYVLMVMLVMSCQVLVAQSSYERCHCFCGEDAASPSTSMNRPGRQGKSGPPGPKGDKGERGSCTCSQIDDVLAELVEIKTKIRKMEKLQQKDCSTIKQYDSEAPSGVYRIFPVRSDDEGFEVYCDMETDGGGWTIFQRRFDGSVDFFRSWVDYVGGFGEASGEYWLGLERLHLISTSGVYELRIDLSDFEGNDAYAHYSTFSVSGGDDYTLTYGTYSGTAGGDGFEGPQKFSTKDRDQDTSSTHDCAKMYKGGWWYESCHVANLNGLYLRGTTSQYAKGMVWRLWKGYYYSLKSSEMKFRKVQ